MSDVDSALAVVDAFEAEPNQDVAWQLDRYWTLQRLRTLLRNPELIDQRGLNACAPAVFFRVWLARAPAAVADFACALLRDGSASIGSLNVAPSWKLLGQNYANLKSATDAAHPHATPENADWMLLSALRDSENLWFDYAGEPYTTGDAVAGLTLPSTLASWLNATNLYSSVVNDTNLVFSGDRQELFGSIPTSNTDIILLVNATAIFDLSPTAPAGQPPAAGGLSLPNHYILMTAPFASWNDPAWITIDCWSWGKPYRGWQGTERFFNNYFGILIPQV
jgi:hypothetical protein